MPHEEHRQCAHLHHLVCDAWPMRHQTCGYLPSHRASPSFDHLLINTAWWQEAHVCGQLAHSHYLQRNGRESNPWRLSHKFNALTITPPGHTLAFGILTNPMRLRTFWSGGSHLPPPPTAVVCWLDHGEKYLVCFGPLAKNSYKDFLTRLSAGQTENVVFTPWGALFQRI